MTEISRDEEWACEACFCKNPMTSDFCQVCYYPQSKGDTPEGPPVQSQQTQPVPYPQSGHPQSGHPQSGHPQSGHPQSGHPQSGHSQHTHVQTLPHSQAVSHPLSQSPHLPRTQSPVSHHSPSPQPFYPYQQSPQHNPQMDHPYASYPQHYRSQTPSQDRTQQVLPDEETLGQHGASEQHRSQYSTPSPELQDRKRDEIFQYTKVEMEHKDRKKDGEVFRYTPEGDNQGAIDWIYAISMKPFYPGQGTVAEKNAKKLVELLQTKFGSRHVQLITGNSEEGEPGACIKVGCTIAELERYAEEQKTLIRVKPDFAERTGQYYHPFSPRLKRKNVYAHPCLYTSAQADFDFDCVRFTPDRPCQCDILLPFQKEEIVRIYICQCIDTFMGEKFDSWGLKSAIAKGVIKEIFPLHMAKEHRANFIRNYISWNTIWRTPWTVFARSHHFIEYWRGYFGEKLGMYMAFLHYYLTGLVLLAIPGTALIIYQYLNGADNLGVPLFNGYVVIWVVVWYQYWLRKQAELAWRWGTNNYEEEERELSDFTRRSGDSRVAYGFYNKGEWVDLELYASGKRHDERVDNIQEELSITQIIPKNRKRLESRTVRYFKFGLTSGILLTLLIGVSFCTLGLLLCRLLIQSGNPFWGGFAGGVLNGGVIAVLDQLFIFIAVALVNWERYRTTAEYEEALAWKVFLFQFINAFFSLFYIAFYKGSLGPTAGLFGHTDYCKDAQGNRSYDCMTEMSTQVAGLLLTRSFIRNMWDMIHPWASDKFSIYKKDRRFNDRHDGLLREHRRTKDPVQAEAEKQPFSTEAISGTFYLYSELAVQLGYAVLFAPAFPFASAIVILITVVEMAINGEHTLDDWKKPVYTSASDLGPWTSIFGFLCAIAICTNMLMLGFTSAQLDYLLPFTSAARTASTKWTIVYVIEHVFLLLFFVLAFAIPTEPAHVREKKARSERIQLIETDYNQNIGQWQQEKDQRERNIETLAAKFQYDASEDDKDHIQDGHYTHKGLPHWDDQGSGAYDQNYARGQGVQYGHDPQMYNSGGQRVY